MFHPASQTPDETLSAEELKTKLLEKFRDSGTLDGIRAQLRCKLFLEMFKVGMLPPSTNDSQEPATLLPLQISNWIIYNHLKVQGLDYTLSTFVAEAQLSNPDKQMTFHDVLHLLGVDLLSIKEEELKYAFSKKNFLFNFLKLLMNMRPNNDLMDDAVEVDGKDGHKQSVFATLNPTRVFNEIFSREKVSAAAGDAKYPEQNSQSIHLLKEKYEKEVNLLKQKLVQELDKVHTQEQQTKLEIEQSKLKLEHELRVLELDKEKLKMREDEFQKRASVFNEDIDRKIKLFQDRHLSSKSLNSSEIWEQKLRQQQQWFEDEISKVKNCKEDSELLKKKLSELEASYKMLQSEYASLLTDNCNLKSELTSMTDYGVMKEELLWKSRKLENYEKEIRHMKLEKQAEKMSSMETIQKLQQQVMQDMTKTPTIHNMQPPSQLHQIEKLEKECKASKEFNQTVLSRIEEQKEDIRELHRLLHALHHQISHTSQHGARASELHQNERTELAKTYRTPQTYQALSPFPSQPSSPQPKYFNKLSAATGTQGKPLQFITEAKLKIDNLQKETEALENKYFDFLSSGDILFPHVASFYGQHSLNAYNVQSSMPPTQSVLYNAFPTVYNVRKCDSDLTTPLEKDSVITNIGQKPFSGVSHLELSKGRFCSPKLDSVQEPQILVSKERSRASPLNNNLIRDHTLSISSEEGTTPQDTKLLSHKPLPQLKLLSTDSVLTKVPDDNFAPLKDTSLFSKHKIPTDLSNKEENFRKETSEREKGKFHLQNAEVTETSNPKKTLVDIVAYHKNFNEIITNIDAQIEDDNKQLKTQPVVEEHKLIAQSSHQSEVSDTNENAFKDTLHCASIGDIFKSSDYTQTQAKNELVESILSPSKSKQSFTLQGNPMDILIVSDQLCTSKKDITKTQKTELPKSLTDWEIQSGVTSAATQNSEGMKTQEDERGNQSQNEGLFAKVDSNINIPEADVHEVEFLPSNESNLQITIGNVEIERIPCDKGSQSEAEISELSELNLSGGSAQSNVADDYGW